MSEYSVKLQEPPFALPQDTIIHGSYCIGRVLGFGGFGITYIGADLRNGGAVAVKEYYPSGFVTRIPGNTLVEASSNYRLFARGKDNFLQEARMIYHCRNPHIPSIYSLFEENGTAYYIMEYLEGNDLRRYLSASNGRLEWSLLEPIVLQIMDALIAVHREGIIHRDVSPDNIYLSSDNTAKLIDFGAARALSTDKSRSVILKKGYAPLEQYQSHGRQGPWTDIYALGGTMYRALTGEMPEESVERLRNDTLRPPSSFGIRLPQAVDYAVMKAMRLREEDRFQRVEDFLSAITGQSKEPENRWSRLFEGVVKKADRFLEKSARVSILGVLGVYASQTFTLDKDVSIGRDPALCSIIFPPNSPGVSRLQCQICVNSLGFRAAVIDCNSTYGTFLNGRRLSPGIPTELNNGDLIQIGNENVFQVNL